MKKLAIIGKGTAGSIAAAHFLKHTDWQIDLYFDSSIKPQAVGEATWPGLTKDLYNTVGFNVFDLESIDGTFKTGVSKAGWGERGLQFFHHLLPGSVAYHFNAVKLQTFIFNKIKENPRVSYHDKNIINYDDIDADFIMDCSGKPSNFNNHHILNYIAVNAVHVTMCYWERPEFQYSLANATKYGWHFGIPLQNRCAVGYIYNSDYNNLEDVKADALETIKELNLTPSEHTNSLNFKSYVRKENFTKRVAYCGNASFFLEPLEATSFWIGDKIQRYAYDIWNGLYEPFEGNRKYHTLIREAEVMIMLHYMAGSKYKTPFWEYAKHRGEQCITNALRDKNFADVIRMSFDKDRHNLMNDFNRDQYSGWGPASYHQNLEGLSLKHKFKELLNLYPL